MGNCFLFLQIAIMFGLEGTRIFIPTSAFSLLQYIVLVEIFTENVANRDPLLEKSISVAFSIRVHMNFCYSTKTQVVGTLRLVAM